MAIQPALLPAAQLQLGAAVTLTLPLPPAELKLWLVELRLYAHPEDFPAPESFTLVVGFLGSFDMIFRIPLFLPADVGLNVTVTVQEFPFGIVVQLFVWLKSDGLTLTWLIKRADWPLFVITTVFCDVSPRSTTGNLIDLGLANIFGVLAPDAFSDLCSKDEV